VDIQRFQNDLAALTPGNQVQPLTTSAISREFRNGYIGTWTAGLDRDFHIFKFSASYVGTSGVHLQAVMFPNGYSGASPGFAPFTKFDAAGQITGGFSSLFIMTNSSHSTYHALQTSVTQNNARIGLSFQASYTLRNQLMTRVRCSAGFRATPGRLFRLRRKIPSSPKTTRAINL